jgi:putative two-component system response regulator
VEDIALAAPLHDIGKVAIDHRVLRRRGPLSPEERVEMKLHTIRGAEILGGVESFRTACQIARHHHERFDGRGYPDGIAGDEIPLAARITAVADVFDALTTRRCYKQDWPVEDSMDYLWRQGARQFDLEVVAAFSNAEDQIRRVHEELKDAPRGSLLDYSQHTRSGHLEGRDPQDWKDSIQVS